MLWPAALLLIPSGSGAKGSPEGRLAITEAKRRGAIWVSVAVIMIAPFARIGTCMLLSEQRVLIGEAFPTIADSIAFGCLLTCVRERLSEHEGYMRFLRSRWFFLVPVPILVLNRCAVYVRVYYTFGETLLDLLIAVSVDRAVRFPHGA